MKSKAGSALNQVLKEHGIAQNRFAKKMGISRSTVCQWVNETSDPLANSIPDICAALSEFRGDLRAEFLSLYLGDHCD